MLDKAFGDAPAEEDNKGNQDNTPRQTDVVDKKPDTTPDNETEFETEFKSPFDKAGDTGKDEQTEQKQSEQDNKDDFDLETEEKLKEMEKDPHPGEKFRELRLALKEKEQKLKAYESGQEKPEQFQELEVKAKLAEELREENEKLQERLAKLDYRATSEYRSKIEKPLDDIAELASTLDERNGLEADTIIAAISISDYEAQSRAIEDLKDKVDPRSFATISQLADQVITLYRRDEALQRNARDLMKSAREAEQEQQAKELLRNQEAFKNNVTKTFESYQDKIPLFIGDDGNTSGEFESLKKQAMELSFDDMTVEDKAFAALSSVSIGPLIRSYNKMRQELVSLRMANGSSDRSTPKPPESGDNGGSSHTQQIVEDNDFQGFINPSGLTEKLL